MINKVRIMLYVNDVATCVDFWQTAFDAQIQETNELQDNSTNVVLQVTSTVELSLFVKSFINVYSPEVSEAVPSLMFFSDSFDERHKSLPSAGAVATNNGLRTFNFTDPENNHFVVADGQPK